MHLSLCMSGHVWTDFYVHVQTHESIGIFYFDKNIILHKGLDCKLECKSKGLCIQVLKLKKLTAFWKSQILLGELTFVTPRLVMNNNPDKKLPCV